MLLLGWLLGLLGGPISERIRKEYRWKELDRALRAELRECRHLMAALCYRISSQLGEVDRDLITWAYPIEVDEAELTGDESMVENLDRMLQLPDSQLAAGQVNRVALGTSLALRTYDLPLIEASTAELALLPLSFRRQVLSIRQQLDFINQDVPRLTRLNEMTFDSGLSTANRQVIAQDLEDGYRTMARRARRLADQIEPLVRSRRP